MRVLTRSVVAPALAILATAVLAALRLDWGRALGLGFELRGQAYGVPATYDAPRGLRVILLDSRRRRWETRVLANGDFRLTG